MKYLKPTSIVLVNNSLNSINGVTVDVIKGYTATLGLMTVSCDGSGEHLQGIYVTQSQLEQIRDEIDNYLRKTAEVEQKLGITDSLRKQGANTVTFNVLKEDPTLPEEKDWEMIARNFQEVTKRERCKSNDTKQKQKLKINPELVWVEQSTEIPSKPYCAKISEWCNPGDGDRGDISLYALGESEEEARATLDAQFVTLVLRCVDSGVTESKTSSATSADNFQKADNTPAPKVEKAEPQEAGEKSQVFKLNPNRVASRRNPAIKGYGQWEARITLYFGEMPLEVVSSGHMMEESARTALDYKVGKLIDGMTD
jgi:hypothetical protein